jgi:hypothetical protein
VSAITVTPNPFNSDVVDYAQIGFSLRAAANVKVDLYQGTTTASLYKTLATGLLAAGNQTVYWNGSDKNGTNYAPAGVYSIKITASNTANTVSAEKLSAITVVLSSVTTVAAPSVISPTTIIAPSTTTATVSRTASVTRAGCASFYDVALNSVNCKAIAAVVKAGIFQAAEYFRPLDNINRAEVAKVIVTAFKLDVISTAGAPKLFNDVASTDWFYQFIKPLKDDGIAKGYAVDNTYRPTNMVTKEEFVKLVIVAAGKEAETSKCNTSAFSDTPLLEWSGKYLCEAKLLGLIYADGEGKFYPKTPLTRVQAANIFYQAITKGLIK